LQANETRLDNREYNFVVEDRLPKLNFRILQSTKKSGKGGQIEQKLSIEIYSPLSGEIFEASYDNSRIEVDRDGTITYFVRKREKVSFSLFLNRSIIVEFDDKGNTLLLKTPAKISDARVSQKTINGVSQSILSCRID
jgi:hypothetical protein